MVGATPISNAARIGLIRNKKAKTINVKLENLPDDEQKPIKLSDPKLEVDTALGMSVVNLTADMRDKLELKNKGVLVESVTIGSAASNAGIQRGDVIMQLDGKDIKDVEHLKKLAKQALTGKFVSVLINRRGDPIFLALKK
jgi:serine protease Do